MSLKKSRVPKQKSCTCCAKSKVKCNLQVPTCQRCTDRHTHCEYPVYSSIAALSQSNEDEATLSPFFASPSAVGLSPTDIQFTNATLPSIVEQTTMDDTVSMNWSTWLSDETAIDFWNAGEWNSSVAGVVEEANTPGVSVNERSMDITLNPIPDSGPSFSSATSGRSPPDKSWWTPPLISSESSLATSPSGLSTSQPSRTVPIQTTKLLSVDEITTVICHYPNQLLRETFWSPFVHHRHYRCSQGGLAEPIAVALCCVSANQQRVESSLPFVCKMINDERERLVNEFPTKSESLEDALAALHAMCIYQIVTILATQSQKSVEQKISSAQLYHHFLLKMTRRLCQEHFEGASLKDDTASEWQSWTIAETLRRTSFLVSMVNELSYHIKSINRVYYESLHESLVMDMPLPAPDSMWRALNEDEWRAARDSTGWIGNDVMTLRSALDKLDAAAGSEKSESQLGRPDNIQQISNLIISGARNLRREH